MRELIQALAVRGEQPGPVAQVFLQAQQLGVDIFFRGIRECRNQIALADVGGANQIGLVQVGLIRQFVQFTPNILFAGVQPLAQAGFNHLGAVVGIPPSLQPLPLVQQHADRLGIQLLAVLRQRAAALGL